MKVACIGNMNNGLFSLTRYLRDEGVDVDLLLLDKELPHFHPSADTYDLGYQQYTKSLTWGNPQHFTKRTKSEIESCLSDYDFFIGCDSAPAFLHKIGRRLDIFVPFGTDIYFYPFFQVVNPKYQIDYYFFSRAQRAGIQQSRYLGWDCTNAEVEKIISRIGFEGERINLSYPMLYTRIYNPEVIPSFYDCSHWYREFQKIRQQHDLVVFHHATQIWKNSPDHLSWKGNDKLVRGFADFVKESKQVNPALVMCERGRDVSETKKLVRELGIEEHVRWFPLMARKDIMIGLNLADIGSGEFHMSWLSCGTIYETLAMGKPLMHYREDHLYQDFYSELYPMINIRNPRDVTEALMDYTVHPDRYKKMGAEGRQWLQRYGIDQPLQEYLKIIRAGQ